MKKKKQVDLTKIDALHYGGLTTTFRAKLKRNLMAIQYLYPYKADTRTNFSDRQMVSRSTLFASELGSE